MKVNVAWFWKIKFVYQFSPALDKNGCGDVSAVQGKNDLGWKQKRNAWGIQNDGMNWVWGNHYIYCVRQDNFSTKEPRDDGS